MRGGPTYVGLDLGTSGLKGAVLDETGSVVAQATSPYTTHRRVPGAAEQDPADWIDSLEVVVGELAQRSDRGSWAGIGLTAMIPTLVTLDAQGLPTGPAVTWEDGRAERQAARMRVAVGEEQHYSITGQCLDALPAADVLPLERGGSRSQQNDGDDLLGQGLLVLPPHGRASNRSEHGDRLRVL